MGVHHLGSIKCAIGLSSLKIKDVKGTYWQAGVSHTMKEQ